MLNWRHMLKNSKNIFGTKERKPITRNDWVREYFLSFPLKCVKCFIINMTSLQGKHKYSYFIDEKIKAENKPRKWRTAMEPVALWLWASSIPSKCLRFTAMRKPPRDQHLLSFQWNKWINTAKRQSFHTISRNSSEPGFNHLCFF